MPRLLTGIVAIVFSLLSVTVYAAPSVTCPAGNCTGNAGEVAHCMTTTGTAACASGGKCVAQGCKGGCVGSFFVALGSAESNNSYSTDGSGGCPAGNGAYGQWQFCNINDALRFCSSLDTFHANKDYCQDRDEIAYQEANWKSVKGSLGSLIGQTKVVDGVTYTITQAGIMGAAQLCGAGGAISYFKSGSNPQDAGGTSCARYFANFANTVLPPQFMDASTYAKASTDGSCPQTAQQQPGGQGAASPGGSNVASAPSTPSSTGAASTPASSASSPSSSMSSMMPMMMMMSMMMPMMQQMMSANKPGGAGSGGSGQQDMLASMSPLLDALKSLLNGAPPANNNTSSGSGSGAPQSPIMQQLEQLEAQQQQAASPGSTQTPTSAILSQPASGSATGKKHKDYRISCASMSADPSVEGCRSFVPGK